MRFSRQWLWLSWQTSRPRFESTHWQLLLSQYFLLIVCRNGPFELKKIGFSGPRCRSSGQPSTTCSNPAEAYSIFKMGQPGLFLFMLFCSFHNAKTKNSTNLTINDKMIDSMLGTQTRGSRMEGLILIKSRYLGHTGWRIPSFTELIIFIECCHWVYIFCINLIT